MNYMIIMKKKVGILGLGEIGNSIQQVYYRKYSNGVTRFSYVKDLKEMITANKFAGTDITNCEVLHVCIPYAPEIFVNTVCEQMEKMPFLKILIIHSTIKVNTLGYIKAQVNVLNQIHKAKREIAIAHCPVIGVHPNLAEGILTFPMFVGSDYTKDANTVSLHLNMLGIKTFQIPAKASALLKLMSTSYYGVCIAYHAEMKKMCDQSGVDFSLVEIWTDYYNKGYTKLGKANVARPNLFWNDDKIGGHCIIPNAKILKDIFPDNPAIDLILKYSGEKEDGSK